MRIVFLVLLGCSVMQASLAQSWLSPWQQRQSISVTNFNLAPFSDHQVRLDIPYHECMDSSFIDLRFTAADGLTTYDHWTMHVTPGQSATVYVEIDSLPLYSVTDVYMYYGNAQASDSSDPYATMVYFDDLTDISNWELIQSPTVEAKVLADGTTVLEKSGICDGSGAWVSLPEQRRTWKLLTKERRVTKTSDEDCVFHKYGIETPDFTGSGFMRESQRGGLTGADMGIEKREEGVLVEQILEEVPFSTFDWYYTEISHCDICLFNINAILWNKDMQMLNSVYHFNYAMLEFDRFVLRGGSPYQLDYIAVANKSCIEPVVQLKDIESCPIVQLLEYYSDECNMSEGEISFQIEGGLAPYEVTWYKDQDSIASMMVLDNMPVVLDGLSQGQYTIRAVDANGCSN